MSQAFTYRADRDPRYGEPSIFRNGVWLEIGVAERLLALFEAQPITHAESLKQLRAALADYARLVAEDTQEAA